jgi:hypothetical protein
LGRLEGGAGREGQRGQRLKRRQQEKFDWKREQKVRKKKRKN